MKIESDPNYSITNEAAPAAVKIPSVRVARITDSVSRRTRAAGGPFDCIPSTSDNVKPAMMYATGIEMDARSGQSPFLTSERGP